MDGVCTISVKKLLAFVFEEGTMCADGTLSDDEEALFVPAGGDSGDFVVFKPSSDECGWTFVVNATPSKSKGDSVRCHVRCFAGMQCR